MKIPDHYEKYKFYSKDDACIEICHNTEYTYDEAVKFVESLGFKVTGGDMWFDEMFKDWRGYENGNVVVCSDVVNEIKNKLFESKEWTKGMTNAEIKKMLLKFIEVC